RRIAAAEGVDAAARPQARPAVAYHGAAGWWLSGAALRSRFRADDGNRRRDHGQVSRYACGARQMSEPKEPLWISYEQAIAIHAKQLRRFGGAPGLRDEGILRSALERPINKWTSKQAPLAELAAAYAFGLAKNHAFVDGNKRIAFMAMMIFLI